MNATEALTAAFELVQDRSHDENSGQDYLVVDCGDSEEWAAAILAALPEGWLLHRPSPTGGWAAAERLSVMLHDLADRVETEWYNGNMDEATRDRILGDADKAGA